MRVFLPQTQIDLKNEGWGKKPNAPVPGENKVVAAPVGQKKDDAISQVLTEYQTQQAHVKDILAWQEQIASNVFPEIEKNVADIREVLENHAQILTGTCERLVAIENLAVQSGKAKDVQEQILKKLNETEEAHLAHQVARHNDRAILDAFTARVRIIALFLAISLGLAGLNLYLLIK